MIKYVIIFIHLIGLSIYQLFFGDVTASQKMPDKIKAGEEVTVEVIITKEDVNGFAKVQQTLPSGFTAEVIDAKGATFSFKENTVKFIWMALPADNEFTISYKLKTTADLVGDFSIGGKFSFISDNERKNVDIPASSITITKEENIVAEEKTPEVVEKIVEPIVAEEKVIETTPEKVEEPVVASTDSKVVVSTARTIEKIGDKYKVSLKINQKNIDGFAKFVDVIPAGFLATTDNPEGGIFTFKDGEAKILWMSAPKKSEFEVSYFIEATSDAKNGSFDINGSLSYLENDETQKHIINSSTFTYAAQQLAQNETEKVTTPKENKQTTPAEPNKPKEKPTPIEKQPAKAKSSPEVTSTPTPEKGIVYKVQVGAGHQRVSKNYFASRFNLNDAVAVENHDGWVKYIIGKFTEYKIARDKRNDIRNNIKTAFVTAYNQGQRITVQEALMISNQKWYQ
jgi:cell division septation protein DedD